MFRPPVEVSTLLSLEEDAGLVLFVEVGDVDISTSVEVAGVADSGGEVDDEADVGDGVAVDDDGSAGALGLVPVSETAAVTCAASAAETACPSARLDCWSSGLG